MTIKWPLHNSRIFPRLFWIGGILKHPHEYVQSEWLFPKKPAQWKQLLLLYKFNQIRSSWRWITSDSYRHFYLDF
jgi:hypothetical protein